MKPFIIAIDPGTSGGVAILDPVVPKIVTLLPFYSERDISISVRSFLRDRDTRLIEPICVIEQVHASPVMSPSSAFAFGENYGFYRGLFSDRTLFGVTPQQWQAPLKIGAVQGPERKRLLKKVASERFPDAHVTLATCDALLLADYVMEELFRKGEFTSGKIL